MEPPEFSEAMLVYKLCQAYQSLPTAGGVLDQDVALLWMHSVLLEGGYFGQIAPPVPPADPFAGIPMELLSLG